MNPHGFPHTPLKRARIPIPPRRHKVFLVIQLSNLLDVFAAEMFHFVSHPSQKTILNRFFRQSATSTQGINFSTKIYYHKHIFCKRFADEGTRLEL